MEIIVKTVKLGYLNKANRCTENNLEKVTHDLNPRNHSLLLRWVENEITPLTNPEFRMQLEKQAGVLARNLLNLSESKTTHKDCMINLSEKLFPTELLPQNVFKDQLLHHTLHLFALSAKLKLGSILLKCPF